MFINKCNEKIYTLVLYLSISNTKSFRISVHEKLILPYWPTCFFQLTFLFLKCDCEDERGLCMFRQLHIIYNIPSNCIHVCISV